MFNINLNITADPKLLSLLELLAKSNLFPPQEGKVVEKIPAPKKEKVVAATAPVEELPKIAKEIPQPVVVTDAKSEHTLVSVRALAKLKKDAGNEIRPLLDKYGAVSLSSLKEEQYEAFVSDLNLM